jgi:hypothetical protein
VPVRYFAQSFGDPWIRKQSDPSTSTIFDPPKSISFDPPKSISFDPSESTSFDSTKGPSPLPPILPNTNFEKSTDPFSDDHPLNNPTHQSYNPFSSGNLEIQNPLTSNPGFITRFPNFPALTDPTIQANPVPANPTWINPEFTEDTDSRVPPLVNQVSSS